MPHAFIGRGADRAQHQSKLRIGTERPHPLTERLEGGPMLRRDTEYVVMWNPLTHSWLARPVERDGDRLRPVGHAASVSLPIWDGRYAESGGEE